MNKMIESLTPEQTALFDTYVQKWLAIGLSTEPTDFEATKILVDKLYIQSGLTPPTRYFLVNGPLDAIELIKSLDPNMSRRDILNGMSSGCHNAAWLSFYDYMSEVVGLELGDRIETTKEIAKNCGWISFYDDTVVVQQRPEIIKFDDNNRLHCENGPAVRYPDGTSVYSWHGTTIPEEWIEHKKTSLTPQIALTWTNIEQRRCACEILGWADILRVLNSTVVNQDDDPQIGTLLEVTIPEIGREKFLQVICGTGRTFAIPVPPEMTTALEANAWTYGIEPDVLRQLEVRT